MLLPAPLRASASMVTVPLLASMVTSSSLRKALYVPFPLPLPFPFPFMGGVDPFARLSTIVLRELPPGRVGYASPWPLDDWTCRLA
jgi:hypothetical protein